MPIGIEILISDSQKKLLFISLPCNILGPTDVALKIYIRKCYQKALENVVTIFYWVDEKNRDSEPFSAHFLIKSSGHRSSYSGLTSVLD